jgi:hypothetical protein
VHTRLCCSFLPRMTRLHERHHSSFHRPLLFFHGSLLTFNILSAGSGFHGTNAMRLPMATSLCTGMLERSHGGAMFLRHVCVTVAPCSPVSAEPKASPLSASR